MSLESRVNHLDTLFLDPDKEVVADADTIPNDPNQDVIEEGDPFEECEMREWLAREEIEKVLSEV